MKQKDKASYFSMCYENYLKYLEETEENIDKTPLTEEEFGMELNELVMDYQTYFFKSKKENSKLGGEKE